MKARTLEDLWEKRDELYGEEPRDWEECYRSFFNHEADGLGNALFDTGYITACEEIIKLLSRK